MLRAGERRRRGKSDRRATELSMVIRNTLEQTILTELMPRSQIDIYVQVLQADGGTRCACINAAFLALADAGVPMRDIVASCAAGYLQSTPLIDLNYLEDSGESPSDWAWTGWVGHLVCLGGSEEDVGIDQWVGGRSGGLTGGGGGRGLVGGQGGKPC